MLLILGIGAAIAVVLAMLVIGGLFAGAMVRKARKGKSAAAAPVVQAAQTPEDIRRQQLVARAANRVAKRFDEKFDAELDAEIDALSAPRQ